MRQVSRTALFLGLIFLASFVWAQSDTGRLIGTITDPSGAVIAAATVEVTDQATGRMVSTQTSGSGEYVVNALPPGNYKAQIRKEGFKTATAIFKLDVSEVQTLSLQLEAGSASTTVDVTGEVPRPQEPYWMRCLPGE